MNNIKSLFSLTFDEKNRRHNIAFFSTVLIFLFLLFFIPSSPRESVSYPLYNVSWGSQYIKQFDAFKKGRLDIDVIPDEKLAALENPYDPQARIDAGAEYLWDHAYYNGKYYSYFGIAPIFTVYYPYYFATRALPSDSSACFILAVYAVIFVSLAYREFAIRFAKNANLILFLMGLVATLCATGICLGVLCSDVYYIAVLSALGCDFACIFFMLRALRTEKNVKRCVLMALSAISVVLAVLSRPTAALMCVVIVPAFICYAVGIRRSNIRERLPAVISFFLPVLLGAIAVMWFNFARFGSPFDFGANYQLTVNDISKNKIELDFFLPAIFAFFLHPFVFAKEFPFLSMNMEVPFLPDGARYVYSDCYIGALIYAVPIGIVFASRLFVLDKKSGTRDAVKISSVLCPLVFSVAIAFFDFCLAGVNMRYIYDITPVLSSVAAFVMLDLQAKTKGTEKKIITAVVLLLFLLSMISCIAVNIFFGRI